MISKYTYLFKYIRKVLTQDAKNIIMGYKGNSLRIAIPLSYILFLSKNTISVMIILR